MNLKEKIQKDMIDAMKSKQKFRLDIIRLLIAEIKNEEIKNLRELSDEEITAIVQRLKKQMNESYEGYKLQGTNHDKMEEVTFKISVLEEYLPTQLSEEDVILIIKEVMIENDIEGKKDMGKLMKLLMPRLKGAVDGKLVNKLVGELLS